MRTGWVICFLVAGAAAYGLLTLGQPFLIAYSWVPGVTRWQMLWTFVRDCAGVKSILSLAAAAAVTAIRRACGRKKSAAAG